MRKIGAFLLTVVLCCMSWLPALAADNSEELTYKLQIQEVQNGNVSIAENQSKVANIIAGQNVILQISPDEGYITEKVNIKSQSGNVIEGTMKENQYEFLMPEEECQVEAIFSEVPIQDEVPIPEVDTPEDTKPEINEPNVDDAETIESETPELGSAPSSDIKPSEESKDNILAVPNQTQEEIKSMMEASTRAAGIQYYGKVTYLGTTVGAFTINGNIAFCMEHQKPTPDTGTGFAESIYNNDNIRRVLYYGWAGREQWSGFGSYEQGVVVTSLALSYYYSGSDTIGMLPHGSSAQKIGLSNFLYFIEANPVPNATMFNLSKNTVNSYLTDDKTRQRTENITLNADIKNSITIPLKSGMNLVNVSTGLSTANTAVVKGGETFYLTAPLTMNETWSTGNLTGSMGKFNAVLAMTDQPGLQDLGYGLWATDPDRTVNLTVKWEALGQIIIQKTDQATSEAIAGTEFTLYADQEFLNPDGSTVYQKGQMVEKLVTDASGKAQSKPTYLGKYRVMETKQTPGYLYEPKEFFVELKPGAAVGLVTETINVTNKSTDLIVNKIDSKSGNVMPGVVFALQKITDDSVDSGFGNDKEFYTTDENGSLSIKKLVPGKYLIAEYQQLPGYILDETIYYITVSDQGEVSLEQQKTDPGNKSEVTVNEDKSIITLDIENRYNNFILNKTELETGKAMQGVKFAFWKEIEEDEVDPGFSSQKDIFETDLNGNITLTKLPEGIYKLQEYETLEGMVLDTTIYTIMVDYKGGFSVKKEKGPDNHSTETISELRDQLTLDIKNDITKVEIQKIAEDTGKELPGTELEVKDKDGQIIDKWTSTNEPHMIKGVKVGKTYTLIEKMAPRGYLIAEEVQFTVKNTGEIQKVIMKDKYSVGSIDSRMPKGSNGGAQTHGAKTGDNTVFGCYAALLVMGICGIWYYIRRKKHEDEEKQ